MAARRQVNLNARAIPPRPEGRGFSRYLVSDLLSVEQRTTPFEGTVRLRGVSSVGQLSNYDRSPAKCENPPFGVGSMRQTSFKLDGRDAPAVKAKPTWTKAVDRFAKPVAVTPSRRLSASIGADSTIAASGATIGPPDGISYTITSTSQARRMSAACGFNDFGVPNGADYLVERRHYEQYANGDLVRAWDEDFETFLSCSPDP